MVAKYIYTPFLALSGLLLFLLFNGNLDAGYAWVLVFPLALGIGAFVIRNGIEEWWSTRNPPKLEPGERKLLNEFNPYYRQLNEASKAEFEQRVTVFRIQKLFQMGKTDNIPKDLQLLICAIAIQLTMGFPRQKEYYKRLSTIVLFPRTFITPELNKALHAIEVNVGPTFDCLLIANNVFIDSIKRPQSYYNTAIYGFAKAFRLGANLDVSAIPYDDYKETLAKLHVMRNFEIGYIFAYTAIADFEIFEMLVEQFFCFPEQLQKEMPKIYDYLMNIFRQDPSNRNNPVVQVVNE